MKICILGAGALGCAIGGVLTEAGNTVWLCNRGWAHVETMRQHGLTMRDGAGDRVIKVNASNNCQEIAETCGSMDLVLVLVKSFHTRDAIQGAGPILGNKTVVLSLQNGLGHEAILIEAVGRERVLVGKTYAGGVLLGPGHVIDGTQGKETFMGELDGRLTERLKLIADTFNQAGLKTQVSENIMGTVWDKLLVNVATGALSGISRLTYGDLYQVPELQACALAAVAEAMAVAKACDILLSISTPEQVWHKATEGLPQDFKASMLQSLEKGAVTEIDFVNGAVVSQGKKLGIPTPVNQALVACIKGIEKALTYSAPLKGAA